MGVLHINMCGSQAVELENTSTRKVTKYMVVLTTIGVQDTEETIVLGTEQDGSRCVRAVGGTCCHIVILYSESRLLWSFHYGETL